MYWNVFFSIVLTSIFIGCLAINIKKYLENKSNQDILQEINITLGGFPIEAKTKIRYIYDNLLLS